MSNFSIASTIEANNQAQASINSRPIKATIKAIASGAVEVAESFRLIAKTANHELRSNLSTSMIDEIVEMKATAIKHGISLDELQQHRASL